MRARDDGGDGDADANGVQFDPTAVIDGRRHRLTLGLRPLDPATWLLVDDRRESELALKRRLLTTATDQVLTTLPEGDAAATELLVEVDHHLRRHHPDVDRDAPSDIHPVHAAALMAQEDFCVLTREERGWVMTAACVCFPSRWHLPEKVGRTVAGIHDPVPHYGTISEPVDSALDRLSAHRPRWRTNWTLLDDPALFQQQRGGGPPAAPPELIFRVERQTLVRLPRTGAIVFTIRTYRRRLGDITAQQPALAADLATTLESVDPQSAQYKGWHGRLPDLIQWLRVRQP